MSDQFVQTLLEKLIFLEARTGADVRYRTMDPFTSPFYDHLSIQRTARDIAQFAGLTGFTFIIGVAKQDEKVGGHIDLSASGPEVFIEIDSDLMEFPDAVAATLCHEICHKWLQSHGIWLPISIDNEILTDIAAVFLGFGKVMLNGCNVTNVAHRPVANGTQTITKTLRSGYLDRDQFALVYRLVCAMRRLDESDSIRGLNHEALRVVRSCDSTFGHLYDGRQHSADTLQEAVSQFDANIVAHQSALADLTKHCLYTQHAFLETLDAFVTSCHKDLVSLRRTAAAMVQSEEVDPALRYLRCVQRQEELRRMSESLVPMNDAAHGFLRHAKAICRYLHRNSDKFPISNPNAFCFVTCPQDGTKLRLPEARGSLIAICPTCKYRFAYNTAAPEFEESAPSAPSGAPRQRAWYSRLFGK